MHTGLFTSLSVKSLCELVDGRRNLQTLVQNCPLSLQTNVLGPSHKAAEITFGLDILSNAKVLWPFFKQGVDNLFGFNFLSNQRGRSHLLLPLLRLWWWLENRIAPFVKRLSSATKF